MLFVPHIIHNENIVLVGDNTNKGKAGLVFVGVLKIFFVDRNSPLERGRTDRVVAGVC